MPSLTPKMLRPLESTATCGVTWRSCRQPKEGGAGPEGEEGQGKGREGKMQRAGQKEAVDALGLEAAGPAGAHDLPFPSFPSKCEILLLILRGAFSLSTSTGTNGCFHAILSH